MKSKLDIKITLSILYRLLAISEFKHPVEWVIWNENENLYVVWNNWPVYINKEKREKK